MPREDQGPYPEDFTEEINKEICRLGSAKVGEDMVIAIDPGDIRKKYAAKMEYLCRIHDGSEHQLGEGYWLGVPTFFNYSIADGLYNLLFPDKTDIHEAIKAKKPEFQLRFIFWGGTG